MPYETGTATDYLDLIDIIRRLACGYSTNTTPSLAGAGGGSMVVGGKVAGVTENWTVTCTDATTPGAEVWSVVGSVSGAQASITTGVSESNTYLTMDITASGANFAVSDAFTFTSTEGALKTLGDEWGEEVDETTGGMADGQNLLLKGQGSSGTDEIYVNFNSSSDAGAPYYTMHVSGCVGYTGGVGTLVLVNSATTYVPLHNGSIKYHLNINGRRMVGGFIVGTVCLSFYAGFYLPYATPTQMPYPYYLSGNVEASTYKYTLTNSSINGIASPGDDSNYIYNLGGGWDLVNNSVESTKVNLWPRCNLGLSNTYGGASKINPRDNLDGTYSIYPLIPFEEDPSNVYGELDGCFWVSGYNNSLESTITVGGVNYIVLKDSFRSTWQDFFCIEAA